MLSKLQFLAALCVGASYRLWTLVRASWSEAHGIWTALFSKEAYVTDEIKVRRLAVCRTCPIFHKGLQTCGSPLSDLPDEGCHCFMPVAAGAWHNCWIFENGQLFADEPGWPIELNSTWIDAHEPPA